jgi:anti-sigma28 factor (negative regulator of flagellin synthesis)
MRIDGLSQPPKTSQTGERGEPVRSKKAAAGAGDVVEISRDAQEVAELSAKLSADVDEVNPRVEEIRARVQSGYYESRQVREQIAESILEEGALRETLSDIAQVRAARQGLEGVPDVRQERIDQARQRVASGYYDRADIRQQTAERMLDELA